MKNVTGFLFITLFLIIIGCSSSTSPGHTKPEEEFFEWDIISPADSLKMVYDIEIASNDYIFACSSEFGAGRQGVFRSIDNGQSWEYVGFHLYNNKNICIDSNDRLWLSIRPYSEGLFYCSDDYGDSWQRVYVVQENVNRDFINMQVITESGRILLGTEGFGIYKSDDYGENWIQVNEGIDEHDYWTRSMAISPSGDVYFGAYPYIYKSDNNGDSWSKLAYPNIPGTPISIALTSPDNIIVGWSSFEGCTYSTNGGEKWRYSNINDMNFNDFVIDHKNRVYAATSSGVFYSIDNGKTWIKISTNLSDTYAKSLTIDNYGYILVTMGDGKIFRSKLSVFEF